VSLTNSQRQQRFRARRRTAKAARDKLIIDAQLAVLNAKQRALAAAALSAVSAILNATTNQGSKSQCRDLPQRSAQGY
jgi:hypothetical protein